MFYLTWQHVYVQPTHLNQHKFTLSTILQISPINARVSQLIGGLDSYPTLVKFGYIDLNLQLLLSSHFTGKNKTNLLNNSAMNILDYISQIAKPFDLSVTHTPISISIYI